MIDETLQSNQLLIAFYQAHFSFSHKGNFQKKKVAFIFETNHPKKQQLQNVYFLSGLGANKSAFQFLDLSFCQPIYLEWKTPLPKETLPQYANRLLQEITEPNPTIVGLSFGGMLAAEMAWARPQANVIIISSNKTSTEFPAYLRVGIVLPLYNWMPGNWMKKSKGLFSWVLGAKGKEQKAVQKKIQQESNPAFTKAAITMILNWKRTKAATNITHIHGTADKLLPYRKITATHSIPNGTHLMIMDNAPQISSLLKAHILQTSFLP